MLKSLKSFLSVMQKPNYTLQWRRLKGQAKKQHAGVG